MSQPLVLLPKVLSRRAPLLLLQPPVPQLQSHLQLRRPLSLLEPGPHLAPGQKQRTPKHKTRVRVKLMVDTPTDQSPNPPTMAKLKQLYLAQSGEDSSVQWAAWAFADADQCPSITCKDDFPEDVERFKPYTDRLWRGVQVSLWFLLLIACDGNPDNMTSTVSSTMNWWYNDNHSACYPYDVQDSDDAVEVGTLAFSGVHCDPFRLARVLEPIFQFHNGGARCKPRGLCAS